MTDIAIIGGTGLTSLKSLEITRREVAHTPYGEPSGPLTHGLLGGKKVVFLARHGSGHTIPPHMINYRANLWALKSIGVTKVIAVAAVGGIRMDLMPGSLAIPNQVIDYTWGRASTFFEGGPGPVTHIDFTYPYSRELREILLKGCKLAELEVCDDATYGAAQGPRLETAAEIDRLERDGCDIVGMTGMPEAALARELQIDYAACTVIANRAAGRGAGDISMEEIGHHLKIGLERVRLLLEQAVMLV